MMEQILNVLRLAAVPLLLIIYYYWSRRHLYLATAKMKGPRSFPFIGSGYIFIGKSEEFFGRINKILNQVDDEPLKLWLGPFLLIGLKKPEYLEKVISSQKFSHKHEIYSILEKVMGEGGLISASGLDPKIKSYRRKIQPLLDINFINSTIGILHKNMETCVQVLEKYATGEEFDIDKIFFRCTTDMMAEIILGRELNVQQQGSHELMDAFEVMYHIVFMRLLKIWMFPDFLFNLWRNTSRAFHKSIGSISSFTEESIIESWKRRKILSYQTPNCYIPLIDKLTEVIERNPGWMTQRDLVDNLITLYTAAEDTTGTIVSFAALCFGMYPEYQEKAVEEIKSVIGEKPRQLTLEDINKLEYLDMCIKDVLRLFPIAPFILKRVMEDHKLENWTIPRGAGLAIPIYSLHMDLRYWKNPEHFHPDHFLPEEIKKRHCYAYLPFSAGPRSCIGKNMANVTLKYIVATFLQKFKVKAKGKVPDLKLRSDISVRSRNGYKCSITKRHNDYEVSV